MTINSHYVTPKGASSIPVCIPYCSVRTWIGFNVTRSHQEEQEQIEKAESIHGGKFPASYSMDAEKSDTRNVPLDPNHTHFILVGKGRVDQFGEEITLRGKLEKAFSEEQIQKSSGNAARVSIPIVCVVVQGGPNAIQTAYEAIRNGTPVVFVAGSGRAADIMAYAFQHTKEYKTMEGKKKM
eukprot:XP_011664334.1 PREDICTED: transient receptor potential cation channel subfamily M member 2-like [Strongylocentrotus purpuratus]